MNDPWTIDTLHITLRLLLALLLGGVIGFEREQNNRAAGLRTHILVCLGSTLIMLLSMYGFAEFAKLDNVRLDPARLAAQVISGIGFLGAGTILFTGKSITGLTTAASLWVVAAIGLAVGAGFYYASVLTCALALVSLFLLNLVEQKYFHTKKTLFFKLEATDSPSLLGRVVTMLSKQGNVIQKLSVEEIPMENGNRLQITLMLRLAKNVKVAQTVEELMSLDGVNSVSCD
ncbi:MULTISPECIES: MgtC/SapB family protein [Paenibacillus]|uniref:Magnesium transporter MgtC n=1 Tax=Paenibacillus naphthalenovorans TaxID=162209 RepID=A0A0U2M6Z4_9BACL|nr:MULTISPECIES: MgtC/SapB family protein [Paenibacillus]ALS23824.1 magnesium transporter MgtC [Paenibacillus naphthalenovorans]GCL74829.1 magnesium transporter MgtC [Paenibacillus naphthalenovorans]